MKRASQRMTLAEYVARHSNWADACNALGISAKHLTELVSRRKNPSFELAWKIWHWSGARGTPETLTPVGWNVPAPAAAA